MKRNTKKVVKMSDYCVYESLNDKCRGAGVAVQGDKDGVTLKYADKQVGLGLGYLSSVAVNAYYKAHHGFTVGFGELSSEEAAGKIASMWRAEESDRTAEQLDADVCHKFLNPSALDYEAVSGSTDCNVPYWSVPTIAFSDIVNEPDFDCDLPDSEIKNYKPAEKKVVEPKGLYYRLVKCTNMQRFELISLSERAKICASSHRIGDKTNGYWVVAMTNIDVVMLGLPPHIHAIGCEMPDLSQRYGEVIPLNVGVHNPRPDADAAIVKVAGKQTTTVQAQPVVALGDAKLSAAMQAFYAHPTHSTKLAFLSDPSTLSAVKRAGKLGSNKNSPVTAILNNLPSTLSLKELLLHFKEKEKEDLYSDRGIKLLKSVLDSLKGDDKNGYSRV